MLPQWADILSSSSFPSPRPRFSNRTVNPRNGNLKPMMSAAVSTKPTINSNVFVPQSSLLALRSSAFLRFPSRPPTLAPSRTTRGRSVACSSAQLTAADEEWLKKLPERKKPLYSHSLPCIEAWLKSLGFRQSREDRAFWLVEKTVWHAQLSLDVTDLYIRYLKIGPGNLEKDVERRFSYALSREDIENAILGGP